jgi:hypothetical protein
MFCGRDGLTREHLWPEWIGRDVFINGDRQVVHFEEGNHAGRQRYREWPQTTFNVVARIVCDLCNNGWMSDLETQVREFVSPMATATTVTALDLRRQELIARWATKMAMVFERGSLIDRRRYYRAYDLARLKDGLLPDGISVWVAWLRRGMGCRIHWFPLLDDRHAFSGHVATVAVGQFVAQVLTHRWITIGRPIPAKPGPWDDATIQVWRPNPDGDIWPPAPMDTPLYERLCSRFMFGPVPRDEPRLDEFLPR